MSTQIMQVVSVSPNGRDKTFAYECSYSLDSIGAGDWIIIPEDVQNVAVNGVTVDNTYYRIEATLSPIDIVKSGSPNPIIWSNGSVDFNASDFCCPVTAVRLVQEESGSCLIEVRAQ